MRWKANWIDHTGRHRSSVFESAESLIVARVDFQLSLMSRHEKVPTSLKSQRSGLLPAISPSMDHPGGAASMRKKAQPSPSPSHSKQAPTLATDQNWWRVWPKQGPSANAKILVGVTENTGIVIPSL